MEGAAAVTAPIAVRAPVAAVAPADILATVAKVFEAIPASILSTLELAAVLQAAGAATHHKTAGEAAARTSTARAKAATSW